MNEKNRKCQIRKGDESFTSGASNGTYVACKVQSFIVHLKDLHTHTGVQSFCLIRPLLTLKVGEAVMGIT